MKLSTGIAIATASLLATVAPAAAQVRSVSKIEFGPPGVLFVADWRDASVHTVAALPVASAKASAFNLMELQSSLERTLGTRDFVVEDLKVRPGSADVYLAVSYGTGRVPAILRVDASGRLTRVDLTHDLARPAALRDAPGGDMRFWGKVPERSLTVSAMRWHDGKLYLAGLSNQSFASTLRILSYPFAGRESVTSVAMFHTSHDQIETRAPIRTLDFVKVNGTDTLLAAYMCTPLVTIPVSELRDGAHVTGKTIAELGYGNTPVDMLSFSAPDEKGTPVDYVMVTNVNRNAATMAVSSIVAAATAPGLTKPVPWSQIAGVDVVQTPISAAIGIDNLDDKYFVYARRDVATGALQLVTAQKAVKLRISDFVSEYDFPDFRYPAGKGAQYIKTLQDGMAREEGYSSSTTGTASGRR